MYGLRSFEDEKRKVVIYGRVSTEHEAQLSALENQLDWYKPILADKPNWKLVATYVDEGITGTSAEKRPQFLKMIRDAQKGKFDLIITREVSRFARNTVDTLQYTRKLKGMGVEVYFINDGIKTFDGDGELRLSLMATLAQDESRKTSIRVKSGQQTSMENGVFYGNGNILGYDRVGKDLVINPEQAKTVRMMFDLYLKGMGVEAIKFELERQHRLTAMGKEKWFASVISKTLQNTFYCGIITYHKEYTPDYLEQVKVLNHGEIEFTRTKGRHKPIVTEEEFEQVQRIMNSRRRIREGYKKNGSNPTKILWCKLLECNCGNHFIRRIWDRRDGNINYGYECYTSSNMGTIKTRKNKGLSTKGACSTPMIPEWKLKMMAKAIFDNYIAGADEILEIASNYIEAHINEKKHRIDNSAEIEHKEKDLERQNKLLFNYIEMRAEGEISKEIFKIKNDEIEERIFRLQQEIAQLKEEEEEQEPDVDFSLFLKNLKETLSSYAVCENESDVPETIIEAIIKKIVVKDNSFDWYIQVVNEAKESKREPQKMITFKMNLKDAKDYLYRLSTRKRVHKWKDIEVNIWC